MLKKLQALKAKKGFTLVELIVVIAIIAVLAAILVPTLLNQVTNSRITSADSTASTLRDAINAWIVDKNAQDGILMDDTSPTNTWSGTTLSLTLTDTESNTYDIGDILTDSYDFTGNETFQIWIVDHKVKAVAFRGNGAIPSGVSWSGGAWSGVTDSVVKDNLLGTYPKFKLS